MEIHKELRDEFNKFLIENKVGSKELSLPNEKLIADFWLVKLQSLRLADIDAILEMMGPDEEYGDNVLHLDYTSQCHDVDVTNQERQRIRTLLHYSKRGIR